MKITCDIIKDLMPSYVDEICTEDSRQLMEEHIQSCANCRQELENMKVPMEAPEVVPQVNSEEPFRKIKRKNHLHVLTAILSTSFLLLLAMFTIQEVGDFHDYFYPKDMAGIYSEAVQDAWTQVDIGELEYMNFSSIFYHREIINDANSSGSIKIRILDEDENVIVTDTELEPGESVNLKELKRNRNYIIEAKYGVGFFCLNVV